MGNITLSLKSNISSVSGADAATMPIRRLSNACVLMCRGKHYVTYIRASH